MKAWIAAQPADDRAEGALRWIASYERAIAKGDVRPCRCSGDVAARGKSRPDYSGPERPRATTPAVPA